MYAFAWHVHVFDLLIILVKKKRVKKHVLMAYYKFYFGLLLFYILSKLRLHCFTHLGFILLCHAEYHFPWLHQGMHHRIYILLQPQPLASSQIIPYYTKHAQSTTQAAHADATVKHHYR